MAEAIAIEVTEDQQQEEELKAAAANNNNGGLLDDGCCEEAADCELFPHKPATGSNQKSNFGSLLGKRSIEGGLPSKNKQNPFEKTASASFSESSAIKEQ